MLNIKKIPVGELEANCYLVSDSEKNAVIVDAGAESDEICSEIESLGIKPLAILLTHGHFDHFGAAAALIETYHIPLYVHSLDRPLVLSPVKSLAVQLGFGAMLRCPDEKDIHTFEDNDILKFSDELEFLAIHTPGHSPGGSCFRHGDILFSGDTLFRDSVGRVDFPGCNIQDMRRSLARLGALSGDCKVYTGHFSDTTLEHERTFGHYLIPQKQQMPDAVSLQRAIGSDCETILQMQHESFAALLETYQDYDLNPANETAEQVMTRLRQPETYYYFIVVNQKSIGAIRIVDEKNDSRKRISPLFILPEYRNRGYAQAAIHEAERIHGASNWSLTTIMQEAANCHLYEKMGYRRTGTPQIVNARMTLVNYEKDL